MKKTELYEDQQEFVENLRDAFRQGYKSILGVASPAFGKTVVAGYLIQQARIRNPYAKAWFLVHRKNLLRQTSKSFWRDHIEHGLLTSGKATTNFPVQVATVGTAYSRMKHLTPPSILFVDETHLAKGSMFETVIKWVKAAGGLVIGLTGTPERLDGKPLSDIFEVMIEARSTRWLIEQGRLSDFVLYSAPDHIEVAQFKKQGGDYDVNQMAKELGKPAIMGDTISQWRKLANGLRTVVYCCNRAHSRYVAESFNAASIPAVYVDGDSTEKEIKDACEGMASGKYLVMVNCDLMIEGFDLSAQVGKDVTLECCILLRRTMSLSRYLQMVFRALRKKPNKAVILDQVGNYALHGYPDDHREWNWKGKKIKKSSSEEKNIGIQECKSCRGTFRAGVHVCPHCGSAVEFREPKPLDVVDVDLQEVSRQQHEQAMQKRLERAAQGMAKSLPELVRIGVSRSMKNPAAWAANVYASRAGRKPVASDFLEAKRAYLQIKQGEAA